MDTSTTPTPSSILFPSWKMITVSENAIKISIAFELLFSAALADVHIQGCRKCVGFSLMAGSGGDSHPCGFSPPWIQPAPLTVSVWTPWMKRPGLVQRVWAHPWGPCTFLGSAQAPFPGLFPACLGTFTGLHLAVSLDVPDSVTSWISMMAHRVTHKIFFNLWLSNKSPN